MKTIALEDLVTLVCTDFVKENKQLLRPKYTTNVGGFLKSNKIPYLTMNFAKRRKISEKLLYKIEQVYIKNKS